MKKLFLYIALLIVLFFASYGIGYGLYLLRASSSEAADSADTEQPLSVEAEDELYYDESSLKIQQEDLDSADLYTADLDSTETVTETVDSYRLACSGGYVVVLNPAGTLWEYTDIELSLLPMQVQQDILQGISFETIEQVYDYLESIAS